MIKPMLCHDTHGDFEIVPKSGWIIEPKLDGWRWIIDRQAGSVKSFGGRNAADWSGSLPAIEQALEWLPVGTVLDCELVPFDYANGPAVSTGLANGGDGLMLVVFDVLWLAGNDMTGLAWVDRRKLLDKMAERFDNELVGATSVSEVSSVQHEAWLAAGFEGCVAKRVDAPYRVGKRSRDWLKVKPQSTAEATVTGWVFGKGASNKHRAGALEISMDGSGAQTTCGYDCSPEEAELMVGRLIEIRHHGIGDSGKPRHPVFSRTRDDLEPVECPAPVAKPVSQERQEPRKSKRNYGAMGDAKLCRCFEELSAGSGDAFARSDDPSGDLMSVKALLSSRGLDPSLSHSGL